MFENIGSFFKKIMKNETKELVSDTTATNTSKDAAKERLHLVLMQDRANVSADFLELMKQEIVDVIKKYIVVEEDTIDVRIINQENDDGTQGAPSLCANIPILNIRNDNKGEKFRKEQDASITKDITSEEIEVASDNNSNDNVEIVNENLMYTEIDESNYDKNLNNDAEVNINNLTSDIENDNSDVNDEVLINNSESVIVTSEEIDIDKVDDETEENKEEESDSTNINEIENLDGLEKITDEDIIDSAVDISSLEDYDYEEDDDDVTFDDLLKAAEEEEKMQKQTKETSNKTNLKSKSNKSSKNTNKTSKGKRTNKK